MTYTKTLYETDADVWFEEQARLLRDRLPLLIHQLFKQELQPVEGFHPPHVARFGSQFSDSIYSENSKVVLQKIDGIFPALDLRLSVVESLSE